MPPQKAICYARFSPRPKAKDRKLSNAQHDETIEHQLQRLRDDAQSKGQEVIAEYHDEQASGKDADRAGLWTAIGSLKRGQVLKVTDNKRLARDVLLAERLHLEAKKRGAQIEYLDSNNGDTPQDKFIRQIFQAFAEMEREVSAAKTKYWMNKHQADGRRMGRADRTPYGWKQDPSNPALLLENPEEQQVIAWICEQRKAGKSLGKIADELEEAGIKCRDAKAWYRKQVLRVLKRAGVS